MCRNSDDFVRAQSVTIAPLIPNGGGERLWEMEAYSTDKNHRMYVNFLDAISVPILALDLTVFSKNGKSVLLADSECPTGVVPAWSKRHKQVLDEVKSIVKQYKTALSQVSPRTEAESSASVASADTDADKVVPDNDPDAEKLLCQALTKSVPGILVGAIDVETPGVSYNIERVSRLKPPYASVLLRAYATYLARDGFDHDLTRTNKSTTVS